VRIHIHLDHEPSRTQDLEAILAKVFLNSGEDFSELVPPYWKEFCSHMNDPDWSEKEVEKARAEERTRKEEGIAPVPVRVSNPEYSKMAREAKITGSLVLSVGIDEYGHVSDIVLIRPLGMGLDENAVEKVRTWTFKPAQVNGHVRAVKVVAEISFRLF
jgi:TonB family protein